MNIYNFLTNSLKPGLHYRVYPDKNKIVIFDKQKVLQSFPINIPTLDIANYGNKLGEKLFKTSSLIKIESNKTFQKNFFPRNLRGNKMSLDMFELSYEYDFEPIIQEKDSYLLVNLTVKGYPTNTIKLDKGYAIYKYDHVYKYWIITELLDKNCNSIIEF